RNNMPQSSASTLSENFEPEQGGASSGPDLVNLTLGFLRRHYLAIIVSAALTFAASVAALKIVPPVYTAQARVLLGSSKAPVVQPQTIMDDTPVDLESQIEILKSKAIATVVINQLNLADDPDFSNKGGAVVAAIKAIRNRLTIIPQEPKVDRMDELV